MGGGGGGTKQDFQSSYQAAGTAFDQWNDYQQRFKPYQAKLIDSVNYPDLGIADENFAKTATKQAFDAVRGAEMRDLNRQGAIMTWDQAQAGERKLGLDQAAQTAASVNAARLHTQDSNLAVMAGGMGTMRNRVTQGNGAY